MQLFYSLYWRASSGHVQHGTSQRIITWPQDGVGDYLQAPRSLVLTCAFQIAAGPSGNSQTWLGLPQSPALHTVMQMGRVAMYTVVSEGCVSQDTMAIDISPTPTTFCTNTRVTGFVWLTKSGHHVNVRAQPRQRVITRSPLLVLGLLKFAVLVNNKLGLSTADNRTIDLHRHIITGNRSETGNVVSYLQRRSIRGER